MAQFSEMTPPARIPGQKATVPTKAVGTDPAYWLQKEGPPSPGTPGYGDLHTPSTDVGSYVTIGTCHYCGGPAIDEDDVGFLCEGHVQALGELLP